MITLPSIQAPINNIVSPLRPLVRPDHHVAVRRSPKGDKVVFGFILPLSKKAAMQYVKSTGHIGDYRVIQRKTATREGLFS